MSTKNTATKIIASLLLAPLIYLSAARFISQLFVFTGKRTLYENENIFISTDYRIAPNISSLNKLVIFDPLYPEYRYQLARQIFQREPVHAKKLTASAIRLSPIDPEYWTHYGWVMGTTGRLDEGYKAFLKAIELNPGRPGSYIQQAVFLNYILPQMDQVRTEIYKVLIDLDLKIAWDLDRKFYLENPYVYIAAASSALYKNDRKTAISWLNRIPDRALTDWQYILQVWALYFCLNDSYRPIAHFNKLINDGKLTPENFDFIEREIKTRYNDSLDFRYILARIYLIRGNMDLARKELISLNSQREFAEYKILLASTYERQGRHQEAFRLYQQALELSPANQEAKKKVIEYYSKGFVSKK